MMRLSKRGSSRSLGDCGQVLQYGLKSLLYRRESRHAREI